MYYQVGDIVSLVSLEGGVYYGQLRCLLQDQYCEKSAVITWLLPTADSPPPEQGFDPSTYTIGESDCGPAALVYGPLCLYSVLLASLNANRLYT